MSIESIVKKLRESQDTDRYLVIDNTMTHKEGDSEKFQVIGLEAARKKKAEMIDAGTDPDQITISRLHLSKDLEEADGSNESYREFIKKCTDNSTWKKANAICEKYGYQLSKESCVDVFPSGKKIPSVSIRVDHSKEYNPEIYFYAGKFGKSDPSFEIQTTAYGALSLEKHAEFIEAVTNAHKMVEELSKIDFMTLYEDEVNY